MRKHFLGLVLASSIGLACANCTPPASVVPAVFTTEQVVCMVLGLTGGLLSGTPEVVAADVQSACGILPALTQDVINFIGAFKNLTPGQKTRWTSWADEHKQK